MADILQGASGLNANTLIYIVNALNKDLGRVSTLVDETGLIASTAADGVAAVVLRLDHVEEDFSSAIRLKADQASLVMTQQTVATYVNDLTGAVADIVVLKTDTSELSATAQTLTANFSSLTSDYGEIRSWIQADSNGLTLGKEDSDIQMHIFNDRIEIRQGNDVATFWSNAAQQTPKEFIIPEGGSFTMGNFRWIARTGGSMSLIKV